MKRSFRALALAAALGPACASSPEEASTAADVVDGGDAASL